MSPTRAWLRSLSILFVGALCLGLAPQAFAAEVSDDDLDSLLDPAEKGSSCKPQNYGGGSGTMSFGGNEYYIYGGWTNGCKGAGCDDSMSASAYTTRGAYVGGVVIREHWVTQWDGSRWCYTDCYVFGYHEDVPGHVNPSYSHGTGYVDFECYRFASGGMCGGSKTVEDFAVYIQHSGPVL